MPPRTARAPSTSPACLSRRASWTLRTTLCGAVSVGVSVSAAVASTTTAAGLAGNIAAISWSTSSSRLRLGRTTAVSIVRLPAVNVAVVITTSFVLCCCRRTVACARLRAKKKGRLGKRRPLRVGMGCDRTGGPVASVDEVSLPDAVA